MFARNSKHVFLGAMSVALLLPNLASAETTFRITKAFISKKVGSADQPYQPLVGEPYRLYVEWTYSGTTPKRPYHVSFTVANRDELKMVDNLSPGTRKLAAEFTLPLDGTIPWEVEIDPFNYANADDVTKSKIPLKIPDGLGGGSPARVRLVPTMTATQAPLRVLGRRKVSGEFEPRSPSKVIDYIHPRWAIGSQSLIIPFAAGPAKIGRVTTLMGSPTTDSWQKVLNNSAKVVSGLGDELLSTRQVDNTGRYPVYFWDKQQIPNHSVSMFQQFVLELRSVRVDSRKLKQVTWAQVDALKGLDIFKFYTQPEPLIQSNDPKVTTFVRNALGGSDFRNRMGPYEAARKCFQAVLKRATYYFPGPGQPDLRAQNAVELIDTGRGDCGSFSMLLVACYRNLGIPARTACGAWFGQDNGHCWSEMWMPGQGGGWVLSDGSAGNSMSEDGTYAYYFGNLLDLNARFAMMRGNSFPVGAFSASWLQGPAWWYGAPGSPGTISAGTALVEISESTAKGFGSSFGESSFAGIMNDPKAKIRAREAVRCPCSQHGGIGLLLPAVQKVHAIGG